VSDDGKQLFPPADLELVVRSVIASLCLEQVPRDRHHVLIITDFQDQEALPTAATEAL
jgi:hypothetical protein